MVAIYVLHIYKLDEYSGIAILGWGNISKIMEHSSKGVTNFFRSKPLLWLVYIIKFRNGFILELLEGDAAIDILWLYCYCISRKCVFLRM